MQQSNLLSVEIFDKWLTESNPGKSNVHGNADLYIDIQALLWVLPRSAAVNSPFSSREALSLEFKIWRMSIYLTSRNSCSDSVFCHFIIRFTLSELVLINYFISIFYNTIYVEISNKIWHYPHSFSTKAFSLPIFKQKIFTKNEKFLLPVKCDTGKKIFYNFICKP